MSFEDNVQTLTKSGRNYEVYRLWVVREMLSHRNISRKELREATGMSRSRIAETLSGHAFLDPRLNAHRLLDRIEEGIDKVTQERGFMCLCSPEVIEWLKRYLRVHREGHDGA